MSSGSHCIIFGMKKCKFLLPCSILKAVQYLNSYWLILLFVLQIYFVYCSRFAVRLIMASLS